ncbi:hypothetical protein [Streptomyces montanisoli]|uniref:Uncharacterized protein n=1 Tax=Streptomyces montanisoli TaxID=2798581 RepID=A0A940MDR6_9ACTN|nr:hypothetical protein [Streptomyces montanisoli]MBP0458120.1 hypothetical protein [Streptomyces montanisoli]
MPSQHDAPRAGATEGRALPVDEPSPDEPIPDGPFSDEPGAAAEPGATRHRSLRDVDQRLFLSGSAVTLAAFEGYATVRFADAAEVLAHPDGGRILTGPDGVRVAVEPTLYAMLSPERVAAIDAAVPPAAVVATGPREPGAIPRPPEAGADGGPGLSSRTRTPAPPPGRSRARTAGLYAACVAVAAAALLAIRTTFAQLGAAHPHYTVAAMFWVLTAGFVVVARDLRNPPKDRTHIARWWNLPDQFKR